MKTPRFEIPKSWPVVDRYDVVVVGAGPGGISAAVSAARLGAKTLLVEKGSYPGGVASAALVPNLMGFGSDGRQIVGGFGDELVRELDKLGYAYTKTADRKVNPDGVGDQALMGTVVTSAHGIQVVANRMLKDAGVDLLYYTQVIGAHTHEDRITAIAVDRVDGPGVIEGSIFIDATGDAQLVWRAGGDTREAEPGDAMTKTLFIDLGGVEAFDVEAAKKAFDEQVKAGTIPVPVQDYFMAYGGFDKGVVHFNFTAVTGDALQSKDLTRMDIELREQIEAGLVWFRTFIPGFERCFLSRSANTIGVRAGRSAVGLETITRKDIDDNSEVAEPIGIGIRRYGDHGIKGFSAGWAKPVSGTRAIPWKTILSADFSNVALAGRAISCETKMITCIRYMAQCFATGQAAGTNAALAIKQNTTLLEVGYPALASHLKDQGAIL